MDLRESIQDLIACREQRDASADFTKELFDANTRLNRAGHVLDLPALLAALDELDALKGENARLVAERDSGDVQLRRVSAQREEAIERCDTLRAELADLRERAGKVHEALREHSTHTLYSSISGYASASRCRLCNSMSDYGGPESHAPDCPARPDFLTTSATESRGAKGGNDERNAE